jgi:hypothetical protein
MSIGGYQVSFEDIQNEFGGSNPVSINEYYRDTLNGLNTRYVVNKQSNSDHPNTSSIASSGQIDLASFRNTTCLLGFNRYVDDNHYSSGFTLHFYTYAPGAEDLQINNNDYQLETANYFYIFSTSFISGTQPLYRFFADPGNAGHLFTTDPGEGAGIAYEGIVGYVRTYQTPNSLPVYRGFLNGDWFYTFDPNEFNNGGYANDGIKFYAYQNTNWRA